MDWLWSEDDEVRFAKENLHLQSLYFIVPSFIRCTTDAKVDSWRSVFQKEGLPQLTTSAQFRLPSTNRGWLSPDGTEFICLSEHYYAQAMHQKWRLRIGEDFDLFVADGTFCGWALSHPLRYLTIGWDKVTPEAFKEDRNDVAFLHDYFLLISDEYMVRFEEGDASVLTMLVKLRVQLERSEMSVQRKVILHAVKDVIDALDNQ